MCAFGGCGAEPAQYSDLPKVTQPGRIRSSRRVCEEPAWGSDVWRSGRGRGREGSSILERMTARNAGGAGSLPGLPESQSPSCDPSREGRPGRVGGSGRGGQAVTSSPPPGGSTRCSLLASAAGWGGDSGRRSERRTEGLRRREAAPPPSSCSAAGPARRGGPTSVPRAVAGASSGAAGPRPCLRAARSVSSLLSLALTGAACASAVRLLGCLSPLYHQLRPPAWPPRAPGAPRGDEERGGAGAHGAGRAGRTERLWPMRLPRAGRSSKRGPWGAACGWRCWALRAWARRPSSASSCSVTTPSATGPRTGRASTGPRCCSTAPSTT